VALKGVVPAEAVVLDVALNGVEPAVLKEPDFAGDDSGVVDRLLLAGEALRNVSNFLAVSDEVCDANLDGVVGPTFGFDFLAVSSRE
jgi:hypothetical protein